MSLGDFLKLVSQPGAISVIAVMAIALWMLYSRKIVTARELEELKAEYRDEIARKNQEIDAWRQAFDRLLASTRGSVGLAAEIAASLSQGKTDQ